MARLQALLRATGTHTHKHTRAVKVVCLDLMRVATKANPLASALPFGELGKNAKIPKIPSNNLTCSNVLTSLTSTRHFAAVATQGGTGGRDQKHQLETTGVDCQSDVHC